MPTDGDTQNTPSLSLETGGHTAVVKQLLFTPDGRTLISVGGDKIIRLWEAETGHLLDSLRGEIGPGPEGMIYAAALSPDGGTLATGGYSKRDGADWITLFDLPTGRVARVLQGHTNVVHALAFTSDGLSLASGSSDNTARVWDVTTGETLLTLSGHTASVYGIAFSPTGACLVTASLDGTLRLWDTTTGRCIRVMDGHGAEVGCVAYAPDGLQIASGSDDKTVRLWDGTTGEYERTLLKQSRDVLSVAFDGDGSRLATTTGFGPGSPDASVWRLSDGMRLSTFGEHTNTVYSSVFSPDGMTVASTGGNEEDIWLWDAEDGSVRQHIVGAGGAVWSVGWQRDGASIGLGRTSRFIAYGDRGPLECVFNPLALTLEDINAPSEYIRAQTTRGRKSLTVSDPATLRVAHESAAETTISAQWASGDRVQSFGFTPAGDVVVGTDWALELFDASSGTRLREFEGHTGAIWAVACSPDGRFLASGSGDQTVRIWSLDDDADTVAPLLSLFVADDGEWVCWTEKGYYACSPNGDRFVGWHINQGKEHAAKFAMAYQFRRQLYRPDIVSRVLETGDVDEAERLANEERGSAGSGSVEVAMLSEYLPPEIVITEPFDRSSTVHNEVLRVRAVVRRVAGQEITSARILLNGHGLLDGRGRMAGGDGSASEIILDEEVTLVEGENTISVVASNAYADSETQTRSVTYTAPGAQHTGPNLYVLAIGISSYMHGEDGLDYCHLDAGDFVDECKKQEHGFYGQVTTRLLRNEEATRTRVLRSLQWLAKQATQHDMVFIFMAAHGSKDDAGDAYLVCHDTEPDFLVGSGVRWTDFPASLHGMPFRTVMFVDTCYSGGHGAGHGKGMARFQVDRDFTQAYKDLSSDVGGMVVFASSTAAEVSWEHAKWQNGAFTEALLEGMAREASHPRQVGEISDHELSRFVAARVKELTDGEQHPVWFRPKTVDEFTLLGVPTAK